MICLLMNMSCLYSKVKIYPLKHSMSADIIKMLGTTHQSMVSLSYCIRNEHIICPFYLIGRLSSLSDTRFLLMDTRNYSWFEKNAFLLLDKFLRQLPQVHLQICKSCKDCSKRCVCLKPGVQNIYNIMSEQIKLNMKDWLIFWKLSFALCPHPIRWLFRPNSTSFCTEITN